MVGLSMFCIMVWAFWINPNLAFVHFPVGATMFPLGPSVGPLVFGFGLLFAAWMVHPGRDDG